jgi:hypothetical protein
MLAFVNPDSLFKCLVRLTGRERERERKSKRESKREIQRERESKRERKKERGRERESQEDFYEAPLYEQPIMYETFLHECM